MRYVLNILAVVLFVSFTATQALSGEKCTCRYKGQDIAEGVAVCMALPNGSSMAMCERVLNNTSWKFLKTPCPVASYQPRHDQNMTKILIPTKS